jgi:conjugative relaxase-like TrwC/TraI family protein
LQNGFVVLGVARLSERTGRYYLDDLAAEFTPLRPAGGGDRGPGRWTGAGAAGLGLVGSVDREDLEGVLAGCRPQDGRPLVARRGGVSGYDLTFTAPKSVSVLVALAPPEVGIEALSAHEASVDAAMGYVERRAAAVRRGTADERRIEPVAGLVEARFTHGVSRAHDPHLHTHVVVANLGHGPDGRWTALDGRGFHAHAPTAGALYDAELRHRLSVGLGLQWRVTGRHTYELAGVADEVVGAFSARSAEIRAQLAAAGRTSARASRVAWASTRDPKEPRTPEQLGADWQSRAEGIGWNPVGLTVEPVAPGERRVDEQRFAHRVADPLHGGVTRRQVLEAWVGAATSGSSVPDAEQCVDRLAEWGVGIGVGEGVHPPSRVVPARHLLAALGPRPSSPPLLETWQEGARAVADYRARWGVEDRDRPLGVTGAGGVLAALPARRLADHLATSRQLDDVRRRLGREIGRGAEPPELGRGRD